MPLSCSNKLVDVITKFQTYETSGVYYVLTKYTLVNDIMQMVLLTKKLNSIFRWCDDGGREGGRSGGVHEEHIRHGEEEDSEWP